MREGSVDCQSVLRMIGPALDLGMDTRTLARLMEHLEQCDACRSEAEGQFLVRQILTGRPDEPLPDGFAQRLAARLDDASCGWWLETTNWRAWSIRLMPAAAALLGFALAGSGLGRTRADLSSEIVEWGMHESGIRSLLGRTDFGLEPVLNVLENPPAEAKEK